jgi:hypothetical protein
MEVSPGCFMRNAAVVDASDRHLGEADSCLRSIRRERLLLY